MKLTLNQFTYQLPEKYIAQQPVSPRDSSKLLVVDRQTQQISTHFHFRDLANILNDDYVLVRNNTKVIPARLWGHKDTGGKIEVLLLKRKNINEQGEVWECLTKPGLKLDQTVEFSLPENIKKNVRPLSAKCEKIEGYTRLIQFNQAKNELLTTLSQIGHTPIPPYIKWNEDDEVELRQKYQTIYAKYEGSAAAPTAGLHFTEELDENLQNTGIKIRELTLHVGLGTFQPVKTADIKDHDMHSEWYELSAEIADQLNQDKAQGKKIISVGTTSTRVLETCADQQGLLHPSSGETDIFIYPGYQFKFIDGLITNFHLPESTLLMLVSSLCTEPNTEQKFLNFENSLIGQAYQKAMENDFRFYSFGDAMLIL